MYNQFGNVFTIKKETTTTVSSLPVGTYTVEFNEMNGMYFLQKVPNLTLPSVIYGDEKPRAKKILNTFMSREGKNTGILLSGNKGSGKTLLAKVLCNLALDENIPVVMVQTMYDDAGFINFINDINERAVVMFDEFDKTYRDNESQDKILTLLDGTGRGNKMFIMTTNTLNVSEYLLNRPSRIFYHFKYRKIPRDTVMNYVSQNLKNKDMMHNFGTMWDIVEDLSFDVVQSIVEELNRYPDHTFIQAIRDLNVEIACTAEQEYFPVYAKIDGVYCDINPDYTSDISVKLFMQGWHDLRCAIIDLPKMHFNIIDEFSDFDTLSSYSSTRFKDTVKKYCKMNNIPFFGPEKDFDSFSYAAPQPEVVVQLTADDQKDENITEAYQKLDDTTDIMIRMKYDKKYIKFVDNGILYHRTLRCGKVIEIMFGKAVQKDLLNTIFSD